MAPNNDAETQPAIRQFTWQELALHNKHDDAYVAIRGNVYDVTEWMDRHPGGRDVLLLAAGRDATQVFETYHLLATEKLLPKFLVGTLTSNELPVFPPRSKFHLAVKQRIEAYFKDNKLDAKHAPWMWVRYGFIFAGIILGWYLQLLVAPVSFALALIPAVFLGWCCALVGLMPMHDGSHFSTTHSPLVWKMLGATHDFFNGASYLIWLYQHMLGHHAYTNIDGADPDLDVDDGDLRRLKYSQRWYIKYIYQHIYAPIIYGFLGLRTRYQDIFILHFSKLDGAIRVNPPTASHLFVFWAGKIFLVIFRLVIPSFYLPLWQVLALFMVADFVSSYWLAILFQANHVTDTVHFPSVTKEGMINMDWAEMQVITTQDYAHGSWFWTVFSGSLNYQVVHHLFPNVNQFYYPQIAPLVRQTCKEYGIQYIVRDNVVEAVSSHIKFLYNIGHDKKTKKTN